MEPIIKTPAVLARERYTSKTNKKRNVDMVAALKSSNGDIRQAIDYLKNGFSLSDSTGILLDAWGEQYDIKRESRDDDTYREALQQEQASQKVSAQSRPSIGAFIQQVYNLTWLRLDKVGVSTGAVGAAFNRVPLRMVFARLGGMAPDIELPESLVSATFAGDVYSAATPPNIAMTNHAPMFPGNVFPSVWGGLRYEKTQKTVRATANQGLRVTASKSLLTRISGTQTQEGAGLCEPFNTLVTVKQIEVKNG
ncbi:hypothetical protein KAM621c_24240 [Citrobacter braakii]|uniref:Uncharacterized protein n=1 Tax=Citrobacter braakii TaxID=57706 RepID=A0AAD1L211_CITBR|nr:hypothetical protein KAM621c_24240 [Citrobacter braakii]HEE0062738.1 hypothetical protein [Citrobacter braakii]HEE9823247.1 hypothetical protein [Citrobacter braakii]